MRVHFHVNIRLIELEFNGREWIRFSGNTKPPEVGETFHIEVPILNLGVVRVVRVEMWSSVCYQLYWALRRPLRRKGSGESEAEKLKVMDEKKHIEDRKIAAEDAQKRAIFLSQTFFDWPNPIKFCLHHIHVMVNRNHAARYQTHRRRGKLESDQA